MKDPAKNTPIRALLVDLSVRLGGASVRTVALLCNAKHHKWALASLNGSPVTEYARSLGVEVITVGTVRADPGILKRLIQIIHADGFQVVDGQNPQSKLWGAMAAWRSGVAYVSTLNSWPLAEYGRTFRGLAYYFLERFLRFRTNMHIAVSTEIEDKLLADGVSPTCIALIPAAIDMPDKLDKSTRETTRRKHGLSLDATYCCAVSRLARAKGLPYLIEAMSTLTQKHENLHCLIIGDGPLSKELQSYSNTLGLMDYIHFLGFLPREEVLSLVEASDIFVMPSLTEGTPMAILEAAVLSRPIVASKVGGIPTLLKDGEHALLVPQANPDKLAEAITTLISSQGFATELGRKAKEHVLKNFNPQGQVAATILAYQRAVEQY